MNTNYVYPSAQVGEFRAEAGPRAWEMGVAEEREEKAEGFPLIVAGAIPHCLNYPS